jgi:phthiocerol/phenolphthiocerol synthesis type-I polyketide synthase E
MVAPHLVRSPSEVTQSLVPPNISYFLDHGVRDTGRWFVPLILRLRPGVTVEDVRSVLTAVTNHHDALRLTIVEQMGTWEQHIAAPEEFTQLSTRLLPQDAAVGGPAVRDAILAILTQLASGPDPSRRPVSAAYIVGGDDGPCYLAVAVHHMAADDASRQILMDDIVTAFEQRAAGADIVLHPATTPWREWSKRCAVRATDPAVLATWDYWLHNTATANLQVVDHDVLERPHADDLARLSAPLTSVLTRELDGAQRELGMAADQILLAALGRTIARTIGDGVVAVDLAGDGRSVLEPDVDLRRTVGWFTTIYPVPLTCATAQQASATKTLADVRRMIAVVPTNAVGHVYAPTALQLATHPPSDIFFSYLGTVPALPSGEGPVQFDSDAAMPVRETLPGLGHALELRVYRVAGLLHLDWWYDTRRLNRSTVEELAEQFPLALIDLTTEAIPPIREAIEIAMGSDTFTLMDSSTLDIAQVAGRG